jgi:hypothetical protein
LEQYTLIRFAMCLNPTITASKGIWKRAKRAMDYKSETDPDEREKRKRVCDAVMRDVQVITSLPTDGVLPSFFENYRKGSRTIVRIDADMLDPLVHLWARGFHRLAWGEPVAAEGKVESMHLTDKDAFAAFGPTKGLWKAFYGGPGVQIALLPGRDDHRRVTVYGFNIWEQYRVYTVVNEMGGFSPHP